MSLNGLPEGWRGKGNVTMEEMYPGITKAAVDGYHAGLIDSEIARRYREATGRFVHGSQVSAVRGKCGLRLTAQEAMERSARGSRAYLARRYRKPEGGRDGPAA